MTLRSVALLGAWLLLAVSCTAVCQEDEAPQASVREVLAAEEEAARLLARKGRTPDRSLDSTPLELMLRLHEAAQAGDWAAAGRLLDTRYLPERAAEVPPALLAERLAHAWNQQNLVDLSRLSDRPEGHLDDDLPAYRDQVGLVRLPGESIPVFLQRIPGPDGDRIWRVSNATVARIPDMWDALGYHPLVVQLGRFLPAFRFLGMENWQVVGTACAFVLAWPLAAFLAGLLSFAAKRLRRDSGRPLAHFFRQPVRFFLFLHIARQLIIDNLGLSMTARIYVESAGVSFLAWGVLLFGLITLLRDFQMRRLERAGRPQFVPLMRPFALILKILVALVIGLLWANAAGYNMSTVLAGLGVGSLAVALAAQKTLENVIGALMLYTARPVNPGHLCRFGNVVGWVEEIGLRSTVIRTLDRSRVVIPNAMFSALEIENISARDRIRFFRELQLQIEDSSQLRVILGRLRTLFLAHAEVLQETVSVRLEKIIGASAIIRVDLGVDTVDYQRFLAVAEDLNLRIIDLVQEAGGQFSGPQPVLQLRDPHRSSAEQRAVVEEQLAQWRHDGREPFPDLPDAEKVALRGRIVLPGR